jgi:hypothetical protein
MSFEFLKSGVYCIRYQPKSTYHKAVLIMVFSSKHHTLQRCFHYHVFSQKEAHAGKAAQLCRRHADF